MIIIKYGKIQTSQDWEDEKTSLIRQGFSGGEIPEKPLGRIGEMDMTGVMMGAMAKSVCYFHPKGEIFRDYWNKNFIEEAETAKGVVNPVFMVSY